MKLLDRYILGELLRNVIGGLVLFMGVVLCIYELQQLIRLLVRRGYPPHAVGEIFAAQLPQLAGWVLPVALIFGVILAIGRLSADGELIAMHAGGISFRRILVPVAVVGLLGVAGLYLFNEVLAPPGQFRVRELGWKYGDPDAEALDITFAVRDDHGRILQRIDAANVDTATSTLSGVTITQYRNGAVDLVATADSATFQGDQLTLRGPITIVGKGPQAALLRADRAVYDAGGMPEALDRTKRRPEEMTLAQIGARIGDLYRLRADVRREIKPLQEQLAVRRAAPWCALGFVLVSAPLGVRRIRASTGVSVGIAVLVFLPYYFVAYTLQVLGKHGGLPLWVAAWTANLLLYLVAAGLIIDTSR